MFVSSINPVPETSFSYGLFFLSHIDYLPLFLCILHFWICVLSISFLAATSPQLRAAEITSVKVRLIRFWGSFFQKSSASVKLLLSLTTYHLLYYAIPTFVYVLFYVLFMI